MFGHFSHPYLVCTALYLPVWLNVYQWQLLANAPLETLRADPTPLAQVIMTGVGFLGASVIMKAGLTMAASIWITAASGTLIGQQDFSVAILSYR